MGGMAAQVPMKNDPASNEQAVESLPLQNIRDVNAAVWLDKLRFMVRPQKAIPGWSRSWSSRPAG
jgi:malate synthase